MDKLLVHVFKDSFGPLNKLLNEYDVKYQMRQNRSGEISAAASEVLEIILSPAMWGSIGNINGVWRAESALWFSC